MGRHLLCRRVSFMPPVTFFKPSGAPLRNLEEVCLSVDELEAIRLKDIEELEQEQCAEKMNISRSTFVRILEAARKKMAEALIEGKAIRIEGGHFEIASQTESDKAQILDSGSGCRKRYRRGCGLPKNSDCFCKETEPKNENPG